MIDLHWYSNHWFDDETTSHWLEQHWFSREEATAWVVLAPILVTASAAQGHTGVGNVAVILTLVGKLVNVPISQPPHGPVPDVVAGGSRLMWHPGSRKVEVIDRFTPKVRRGMF